MLKLNHAYLSIKDNDYFDYDLYVWETSIKEPDSEYYVIDEHLADRFKYEHDFFVKSTIRPPKQSTIYITPKMPYPIEDIRNNYKIKRTPDTADYNVIGPLDFWQRGQNTVYYYAVAIFPSLHSIYVKTNDNSGLTPGELYKEALVCLPNADFNDMIFHKFQYWERFFIHTGDTIYKKVLDGTLMKPCVPWNNLDIAGQNPLTNDILNLVAKTGEVLRYEKDAEKNFIMQLNVLNQHNWREYPGTIAMLFLELMKYKSKPANVYAEVKGHISTYSKVIKELLTHKYVVFQSEKDEEFARQYIDSLLNIGDCKFATMSELKRKLESINLSQNTFDQLFNSIVRITPKKYGK